MKFILFLYINLIIYLSNISINNCGLCGLNPPLDSSYCGNYLDLDRTHRCCYCEEISTGNYYCLVKNRTENITGFNCDKDLCDRILVNPDLPGAPCVNHKEIKDMDSDDITAELCHSHSIDDTHPCCYYDDGINKKCFSIGEITSQTLYTYNDFLDCKAIRYKINFTILIFLFILIL